MKSTLAIAIIFLTVMLVADFGIPRRAHAAATFEVNDIGDTNDISPGNGICADAYGYCTLRAAIEEANALPGLDIITFSPEVFAEPEHHAINLRMASAGDASTGLEISSDLTINGPGANLLTVQRADDNELNFRIFRILSGATVSISGLTISNGRADAGGGLYNSGTLTLTRVAIDGNNAGSSGGGGILATDMITIIESTISNNTAPLGGGMRVNTISKVPRIINSTISGNLAGDAGGIFLSFGTMEIISSTITNNTATIEGRPGGLGTYEIVTLANTIVAGNIGDMDIRYGPFLRTSSSYNLIGTCQNCSLENGVNGNQVGVTDPGLAPLAYNGGPTMTHALLPGSPAIDKGRSSDCNDFMPPVCDLLDRDQRGLSRPVDLDDVANAAGGDGTDIGAYEFRVECPEITLEPMSLPNGTVGLEYNATLSAMPDTISYTFDLASGSLPNGLSLDSATGIISGTPNTPGTYNFTIRAQGEDGCSAAQPYTIVIECPGITLTPSSLDNGTVGLEYNVTLSALPDTISYTFDLNSGSLPNGLSLDSATGIISGTPNAPGTYTFTIRAQGDGGCSATQPYMLVIVCPEITLTPTSLPNGLAGMQYSVSVSASPAGTYYYSLLAGMLPPGFSLNPTTGLISGMTNIAGTYNFTIRAQRQDGCIATQPYTLVIGCPEIMLNPASLPNGAAGTPYSATVSATPATTNYIFSVTDGTLPPGLSLNATTGKISGKPTTNGEFTFWVTAKGFGSCSGSQQYTIRIGSDACPMITLPPLPNGTVGKVYSHSVAASPAGSYTYTVSDGLPPGVTFYNTIGLLYGYPTVPGPYTFTITAKTGSTCMVSETYSITINGK